MPTSARNTLKTVFGYDAFRPLQAEIIANVLRKNDTLIIMPTGGGKSLCYQIPALMFAGLSVVVSPLISLMKDQVEQLIELGVAAAFLNSSLSPEEYMHTLSRLRGGQLKLLYLAPETLLKPQTLDLLSSLPVECLTIDEAHCISEWGHDFRPEYRMLIAVRKRFSEAVCIALTATATPRVQQDIKDSLGFTASNEFIASFNRENLFLQVTPKTEPVSQTLAFLEEHADQSGIIYCFSRRQVDELAAILAEEGFSVRPYHAGLDDAARRQNQEAFVRDDVQIVVATIAFGMGIDKPNVRFVLHFDLPKSMESYYQEIGRAGRDGLPAHCLLLFSYADTQKIKYFINQKEDAHERRVANQHLRALLQFAEADGCRRVPLLAHFGEDYPADNCGQCDNCLAGEKEKTDITVPAQKFLSCVARTGEMFGANHIIDVLRGSNAQKVLKFGHQNLSTWGIGQDLSKKQWFHLSRQLLAQGLMKQEEKFGGLKLTPEAHAVFRGEQPVFGTIQAEPVDYRAGGEAGAPQHDGALFARLRALRKELADAASVPPYAIFPDQSLVEMAAYFPQSSESLLQMHGVGAVKLERYGESFLALIRKHCAEHEIGERPKHRRERPRARTTATRRHTVIGEAYNAGRSVPELVAEFGIKQGTVLEHLFRYCQEGNELRRGDLPALTTLPPAEQARVLETFAQLGADYLKPIFDALDGTVGYEELKILRLVYLSSGE